MRSERGRPRRGAGEWAAQFDFRSLSHWASDWSSTGNATHSEDLLLYTLLANQHTFLIITTNISLQDSSDILRNARDIAHDA